MTYSFDSVLKELSDLVTTWSRSFFYIKSNIQLTYYYSRKL